MVILVSKRDNQCLKAVHGSFQLMDRRVITKIKTLNKLQPFDMWSHRRALKIHHVNRVSDTAVLRRADCDPEQVETIMIRKVACLGHTKRVYN